MKGFKRGLSLTLTIIMLLSSLSVNMTVNADEASEVIEEDVVIAETATQREDGELGEDIAEAPSTVTERGMQFKIENLEDVKSIRYAYGEYDTEKDIKYGESAVSHSAKYLRKRGNNCTLQFTKPGLVSIVVTYNDGTRDFYKYEVIKSEPTVTRDGGNNITFGNLSDLTVLRYVKGEYESSYDIKRASGSVAISGKTLTSDTYTVSLDRETYTFCVQYNDESYNYYVTGICGDNLTWVYDMQSATLTISGEGEMAEYDYKKYPWSLYSDVAKKLVIGEGITNTNKSSFCEFKKLAYINLPSTLKVIGDGSFEFCVSLVNVTLPTGLVVLGHGAFALCTSLENIELGDSLTDIGSCAFFNCVNLKELHIPDSIEFLRDQMTYGCDLLSIITLPDKPISLGEDAVGGRAYFNNPDNAQDVDTENGLYYVGNHLVDSVQTQSCIHEIRPGTFSIASFTFNHYHDKLTFVKVPESVTNIESSVFLSNTGILCYENSYAHKYAVEHGYDYKLINN